MTRTDDFRRNAEEAEKLARMCQDATARETYEEIARKWREAAAQAEHADRKS